MEKMLSILLSGFLICNPVFAANRGVAVVTDVDVDASGNHFVKASMEAGNTALLRGENIQIDISKTAPEVYADIKSAVAVKINNSDPSIAISANEILLFGSIPTAMLFTNTVTRSIVTTAAAANGFQVSSVRDAVVAYNVTVSTAVQIGVATNVGGYAVLEVAPTNSSTASDWVEAGARVGTSQNIGLALALSSTETVSGLLMGLVPAGYYARIRSVNSNGTPTYTYNNGREILM